MYFSFCVSWKLLCVRLNRSRRASSLGTDVHFYLTLDQSVAREPSSLVRLCVCECVCECLCRVRCDVEQRTALKKVRQSPCANNRTPRAHTLLQRWRARHLKRLCFNFCGSHLSPHLRFARHTWSEWSEWVNCTLWPIDRTILWIHPLDEVNVIFCNAKWHCIRVQRQWLRECIRNDRHDRVRARTFSRHNYHCKYGRPHSAGIRRHIRHIQNTRKRENIRQISSAAKFLNGQLEEPEPYCINYYDYVFSLFVFNWNFRLCVSARRRRAYTHTHTRPPVRGEFNFCICGKYAHNATERRIYFARIKYSTFPVRIFLSLSLSLAIRVTRPSSHNRGSCILHRSANIRELIHLTSCAASFAMAVTVNPIRSLCHYYFYMKLETQTFWDWPPLYCWPPRESCPSRLRPKANGIKCAIFIQSAHR